MAEPISKRIDPSFKVTQVSSETFRLRSETFKLDEQNQLMINRDDLAKIIQSQSLGGQPGQTLAKGKEVEVTLSLKIKF